MDFDKLKDPIVIIHMIQTLVEESIEEAIRTDDLEATIEDKYDFWNGSIARVYKLIENKLIFLDIALINLKIQDEEKYYKLKDIVCNLDKEIEEYYALKEQYAPYPSSPPQIIKKHVADLQIFQYSPKSDTKFTNGCIEEVEVVSEIELERIKDKVALLIELGVIEHLIKKYPYLDNYALRLTKILSQILNIKENSLKKIINAFITDNKSLSDYPKITERIKSVVDKLTLEK